ncbi:CmcJ/NvfI family oxidoreductase [Paralimibaculum aggregatum]|uniref:CmcJ/NvfI family oxidoreductase n=1 Tax=Paralimibaculum aggregatum TaxID=3036245 RepID=A0ABQ6LG78_9RHOB|nr:CmcJ/NvfI family oxidoreductase [Limibaculum sp. NKW23]GMG81024.1 CmcJ/NvfI family oxidoreductase [Limibaculum sp. NKW23]
MNQISSSFVSAGSAAASPRQRPAEVVAPLTFITPQAQKPVFYSQAFTGGKAQYRFAVEEHPVPIADMRRLVEAPSLDREGFALREAPSWVRNLHDDDAVEGAYFREIAALLTREFGASRVAIFDATRRSDSGQGARNRDGNRGPASRIHVDYTARSGPQRARDVLGSQEVARLEAEGARLVQVNVWRPIRGPVRRAPLALADARSVKPEHLVATDQIFPDRVGEIYHLAYDPAQRWYYAPEMTVDEVLLIKGWDSLEDGRAQYTPHSAFQLPEQDPGAPPRESIEVRTIVVIE